MVGNTSLAFLGHSGGFSHQSDYYNYGIQMIERYNSNLAFLGANPGFPGFFDIPHFMLTDSAFNVPTSTFNYANQTAQRSKGNAGSRVLPSDGSYFGMAGTWVYNHPFFTYGTTGGVTAQGYGDWASLNGIILPADTYFYYHLRVSGVTYAGTSTALSDDYVYRYFPVNYTHLQTDTITPVTGGTWNVPQGIGNAGGSDINYPNMRSCAVRKGEAYDVAWSRSDMPNRPQGLIVEFFALWATDDNVLVSFDWDGATAVSTCYTTSRTFTARTSKADILANRGSNGYWVDTAANKLWVNIYGNAGQPRSTDLDTGLTVTAQLGKPFATLKVNR